MDKEIVCLKNVSKIYKENTIDLVALSMVNLIIRESQIYLIYGPSGAGKSTLLHIIGCLAQPTKGEVQVFGNNLNNLTDAQISTLRNQKIGFIFQFHYLLPEFSALENVSLPGIIAGRDKKEVLASSFNLLKDLGLEKRINHLPAELSAGEQQRVAFARAIINSPELIIADEPTGNLDKKNGDLILDLLYQQHRKGKTIIIATHAQEITKRGGNIINIVDGSISTEYNIRRENESLS